MKPGRADEKPSADQALRPRQLELLAGIEAIFFERGYRAVTMDDLAAALHCSKRALYALAPSRQALFLLVVERWAERIRRLGLEGAARETDPKARLAAFLEPGVTQTVALTENFLNDLQSYPDARKRLDEHQRMRMEMLREIVEDGIRKGRFAEMHSRLVAEISLAGIARINDPDFLREAQLSFSEAFAELYRLLMMGLDASRS